MSKFTPGPWEARKTHVTHTEIKCVDTRELIACVERSYQNYDEEANAHLISQAPELYEALVKARDYLVEIGTNKNLYDYDGKIKYIDGIIAKAEGKGE